MRVVLELVSKELGAPHQRGEFQLEPRSKPADAPASFDIRWSPPPRLAEVKLAPTRDEVLEWARTVAAGASNDPSTHFVFVVGRGGSSVGDLERLAHVAHEATDAAEFAVRADQLGAPAQELLREFGSDCYQLLRRTEVQWIPAALLASLNLHLARALVGTARSQSLVDAVARHSVAAAKSRASIKISELTSRLRSEGFVLSSAPDWIVADANEPWVAAACILQASPLPLVAAALHGALGWSEPELEEKLAEGFRSGVFCRDGETISVRAPVTAYRHTQEIPLLARATASLLELIKADSTRARAHDQLVNLLRLGRRSVNHDPNLVSALFPVADKALKATGDLHLVYEAALLSVEASRRSSRSEQVLRNETQTLICGLSWVEQRINKLEEALAHAETSLRRGEELGWARNTAFCHKCLGRLYRMLAEKAGSERAGTEKTRWVEASLASLAKAANEFAALDGFGPAHSDVGECYSLMGRTHLVAGNIRESLECLNKASPILEVYPKTKEWLDLRLLEAELLARRGLSEDAIAICSEVQGQAVARTSEISEIGARAAALRARLRQSIRDMESAAADYDIAAKMYEAVPLPARAAEARWTSLQLSGRVSVHLAKAVAQERATVQVQAHELHEKNLAEQRASARAARTGPLSQIYVDTLLRQARVRAQQTEIDWL